MKKCEKKNCPSTLMQDWKKPRMQKDSDYLELKFYYRLKHRSWFQRGV